MPAVVILCERNGFNPGVTTENINNINWKSIDDVLTPISTTPAAIGLGSNSYAKYNYFKFSGMFTTIANVKITRIAGQFGNGVKLMSSPSMLGDSNRKPYNTPVRFINNGLTPTDLTSLGSSVNLFVGSLLSGTDGPASPGKNMVANNMGAPVYTNYFITQIQTSPISETGDNLIILQLSYDES